MLPTINNRYRITGTLGAGGMGEVYQATDRLTQDKVALKRVKVPTKEIQFMSRPQFSDTEVDINELRVFLAGEFQTLASLRHPHIISVLDYGFDDSQQPFYTMTYLPNAQNFIEAAQGATSPQKLSYVQNILQALSYLHRRGVLHRDLKPENILISQNHLRVLDFGLAATRQESSTGSSGGTLAYWAPELWLGEAFTEAADLFAVGTIMFQLFAGDHPFGEVNSFMLERIIHEEPNWSILATDPQIRSILSKFLQKDPAERYQRAEEALRDISQALQEDFPESADIRESYLQAAAFTGRDAEMAVLKDGLASAETESDGQLILLGGESGVGKSRLVDEFRAYALVDGWQVLTGQAEANGGAPYQLWQTIIPSLVLNAELSDLEAGVLRQAVSSLQRVLDRQVPEPPELQGKANQQRLVSTIMALLQRQDRPTLLILEDLQWAYESLAPVKQFLKVAGQLPNVLLLGTFRNEERPELPQELAGAHLLQLERLDGDHIAQLGKAILGERAATPEIIQLLTQETEGNTFFIVEVMRALAEEAGQLGNVETMTLPEEVFTSGMQALLLRRINRIATADQQLLQRAAVMGRMLDLDVLQTFIQSDTFGLDSWLQNVSDTAVITVKDNQWMFSHDKLRETLLSQLDAAHIQSLHQQAAKAVEGLYPDQEKYFERLLEHWHYAKNLDRELFYLGPVLDRLIIYAADYDYALNLIERTRQILSAGDPQLVKVLNQQSNCHWRQGSYDTAVELGQQALEQATALDDKHGIATSITHLGTIAHHRGDYANAHDYYQQSLVLRRELGNQKEVGQTLSLLGSLEGARGSFDQASIYLEQSLSIRKEMNDEHAIASTLTNLGMVAFFQERYDEAQAFYEESAYIQRRIGDPFALALNLNNLGSNVYHLRRNEEAQAYYEEALGVYRSIGQQGGVTMCLINLSFVYLSLHNRKSSQTLYEAMTFSVDHNVTPFILELLVGFAWLYLQDEKPEQAWELVGLAREKGSDFVDVQIRLNEITPLLEGSLDQDTIAAAIEAGQKLDIIQAAKNCLSGFS